MKEYWINVYDGQVGQVFGNIWDVKDDAESYNFSIYGSLIYRIHVKLK